MFSKWPSRSTLPLATQFSATPPARHRFFEPVCLGEAARQPQHRLLQHRLDRGGDVHVKRRQQLIRAAHRFAEQFGETVVGHGEAGAVVEIGHVEPERAVRLQIDQVVENEFCEARLAIGRQPHHLVFAGVDLEAGVIGRRPNRAGRANAENGSPGRFRAGCRCRAPPTWSPIRRRRPWSAPRRRRRARDRRRTPRGSDDARRTAAWPMSKSSREFADLLAQQAFLEQLLPQPERDRHPERAKAARRERDIGLQQPLEFEERLVVEHDVVEAVGGDAGFLAGNRRSRGAGSAGSCLRRVKRSSWAAATMRPSSTSAAALS